MDIIRHYVVWYPRWWDDDFDYFAHIPEEDVFDVFGKNRNDAGLDTICGVFHSPWVDFDSDDFIILAEYIDDEDDYKSYVHTNGR